MPLQQIGRLALREEGADWNAYYALEGTMKGAILLGSIRINIVKEHPEIKEAFMVLMRDVVAIYLQKIVGTSPSWDEPQSAPEAERSGHG